MNILVTGGAGYIGSHTVLDLLQKGHKVTVVDNLVNSSAESLARVEKLSGKQLSFHEVNVCDEAALEQVFASQPFDAVIHFAGLKAVGESVEKPLDYYVNNVGSVLVLCQVMARHNVKQLIFSSSATVYGTPESVPISEDAAIRPTNPYGQTKAMIEQILMDLAAANAGWKITILRYFNPIGAHESGQIGENPNGIPNNLLPYITQVAIGKLEKLAVFGDDYPTYDGTAVRDYIHVADLATGHLAALDHPAKENTCAIYNLGTGRGYSVLEIIHAFEAATATNIPYEIAPRRPGDIAECYANPEKASYGLQWRAEKTLEEACVDAWRWQQQNPHGFTTVTTGENL